MAIFAGICFQAQARADTGIVGGPESDTSQLLYEQSDDTLSDYIPFSNYFDLKK